MPRNNKRKKKLSNFKKFLCIYCGILLLAGVITLIMLHSLLKDYEEGMPSGTMDKIVNQFTPDGIGKLLSDNDVKVNEFETNDTTYTGVFSEYSPAFFLYDTVPSFNLSVKNAAIVSLV